MKARPPYPFEFTTTHQLLWALTTTLDLTGWTKRRVAKALGVTEVAFAYWFSGTRDPSPPRYWPKLIAALTHWLTLDPPSGAEARMLATALVHGPFWCASPAAWARTLGIEVSLFETLPRDDRGFVVGLDVGGALLHAARVAVPETPGMDVRQLYAIEELQLRLRAALRRRREWGEVLRAYRKRHPDAYQQMREIAAEPKKPRT